MRDHSHWLIPQSFNNRQLCSPEIRPRHITTNSTPRPRTTEFVCPIPNSYRRCDQHEMSHYTHHESTQRRYWMNQRERHHVIRYAYEVWPGIIAINGTSQYCIVCLCVLCVCLSVSKSVSPGVTRAAQKLTFHFHQFLLPGRAGCSEGHKMCSYNILCRILYGNFLHFSFLYFCHFSPW